MNTIGKLFRLTTFGESHGKAIGGVIDGCPAGLFVDMEAIERELLRRRPGQSHYTSPGRRVTWYSLSPAYFGEKPPVLLLLS